MLTLRRRWQNLPHQIYRPDMRRYRTCRPTFRKLSNFIFASYQETYWQNPNHRYYYPETNHGSVREYKAIPILVVRLRGE